MGGEAAEWLKSTGLLINLPDSYKLTFQYFVRLSSSRVALKYAICSVACSKGAAVLAPKVTRKFRPSWQLTFFA